MLCLVTAQDTGSQQYKLRSWLLPVDLLFSSSLAHCLVSRSSGFPSPFLALARCKKHLILAWQGDSNYSSTQPLTTTTTPQWPGKSQDRRLSLFLKIFFHVGKIFYCQHYTKATGSAALTHTGEWLNVLRLRNEKHSLLRKYLNSI